VVVVATVADLGGRPHDLFILFGLLLGHAVDEHAQPPRRAVALHAAESQPQSFEPGAHAILELLERRRHIARRQFLETELEQQVAGHGHDFTGSGFGSQRSRSAASLISG